MVSTVLLMVLVLTPMVLVVNGIAVVLTAAKVAGIVSIIIMVPAAVVAIELGASATTSDATRILIIVMIATPTEVMIFSFWRVVSMRFCFIN